MIATPYEMRHTSAEQQVQVLQRECVSIFTCQKFKASFFFFFFFFASFLLDLSVTLTEPALRHIFGLTRATSSLHHQLFPELKSV